MFKGLKTKAQAVVARLRGVAMAVVPTVAAGVTCVTAFAASTPTNLPTLTLTTDMLSPLVEGVVANIGVILPVGLGLFAIGLGIRIIPGLFSRFVHM